ncbi:MAG TPA: hypothetical protein VGL39_17555 [Jatrophihabitantaceae bacterium]
MIVALVVSCALASYAAKKPGVYWSRVQMRFVAQMSVTNPNGLQEGPASLVMAAGVVARIIDPSGGQNRVTSPDTTLASEGIRHGWSVTLPNTGGQWANNFTNPWLNVEAVGTSGAEVGATISRLLAQIQTTLTLLEQKADVRPSAMIRLQTAPRVPQLYYQQGSGMRAGIATLILGLGLSSALILALRRFARRGRPVGHGKPVAGTDRLSGTLARSVS